MTLKCQTESSKCVLTAQAIEQPSWKIGLRQKGMRIWVLPSAYL